MNSPAPPLADDERALCSTLAAALRAAPTFAVVGFGAIALAAAALLWAPGLSPAARAAAWAALVLAGPERVLAWRIAFDARLFEQLAEGRALQPGGLDRALHALGLRGPPALPPRPIASRALGARRLLLQHAAIVAAQALLAALPLFTLLRP